MKVHYQIDGKKEAETGPLAIYQTNKAGAFLALSPQSRSRYEGLFFKHGNDIFKAIENLEIEGTVTDITHRPGSVSRTYADGYTETFCLPDGVNALIYQGSKRQEMTLVLDCKAIFESRQWGREFSLETDHRCLVVTYTKKNDPREPIGPEYTLYLAVFGEGLEYMPLQTWKDVHYPLDQQRNSWPWTRHVFNACKLRLHEAAFAVSFDKSQAIELAINTYASRNSLMKAKEKRINALITDAPKKHSVSYALAVQAMDALQVNANGSYAGIPWFAQFWTRDEIISSKARMLLGDFHGVKRLLGSYLANANQAMLSRFGTQYFYDAPRPEIPAADGMGWLFLRINDLLETLEKQRKLKTYFRSNEITVIEEKLDTVLNALYKERVREGLVYNEPEETWMDAAYVEDRRDGFRIEIQALLLAMLKIHGKFLGRADEREAQLRMLVRKHFWNGRILKDGKDDPTVRPNIFLAAYIYPELLTKTEWEKAFDTALKSLWLNWGGLASIAKDHSLYAPESTGENVKSYHRGDSWFWVNNIAAIVMHRLNKRKYAKYVNAIVEASIKEQMELGVAGACTELTSAKELRSEGCWIQLWSNATLIELLREL